MTESGQISGSIRAFFNALLRLYTRKEDSQTDRRTGGQTELLYEPISVIRLPQASPCVAYILYHYTKNTIDYNRNKILQNQKAV